MKKKLAENPWTVFVVMAAICWLVFLTLALTGCTLHFKGENIELETKPPEAKIGQNNQTNANYQLVAADIFKTQKNRQ